MDKLTEKHRQIALLVATMPLEKPATAPRVGGHPNTVTRTLKRPKVQARIAARREYPQGPAVNPLVERGDDAAEEAFARRRDLLRGAHSAAVQLKSVASVQDRSSMTPKRPLRSDLTTDQERIVVQLTPELMQQVRRGMVEDDPDLLDVTPPPGLPAKPLQERLAEVPGATATDDDEGRRACAACSTWPVKPSWGVSALQKAPARRGESWA